ncbi:MAG: hypothetical protein PF503_02350 [Desulfobacula sp.]|nr:hypothetical protein [Desulfobacula sp.]
MNQKSDSSKNLLYLFMVLHVLGAAGTFILSKAAVMGIRWAGR